MIRVAAIVLSFLSAIFFPWHITVALALGLAYWEPLVPLAVGIFIDSLHYTPHAYAYPFFTVWGAVISIGILFVRSRLRTGIIGR